VARSLEMPKRRPPPFCNSSSAEGVIDPDLPSLLELERFTTASLHQWVTAATRMEALHRALYFGLETLRQKDGPRLIDAVRSCTHNDYPIDHWSRIVDYRFSLEPLSVAGSLRGDGGRFNIGSALGPSAFTAFPALYCAEDYPTAFLERFGVPPGPGSSGLTGEELALRKPTSFTHISVRGQLENVLDVSDPATLRPIVDIIKEFQIPKSVVQTARKLGLRQSPWLIRSVVTLQRQLLHSNWRMLPAQFDLPSNSQIFGRLVSAAGVHGIVYPSTRDSSHRCVALFPQNWLGSTSFIEVTDALPAGAKAIRIDGLSVCGSSY